MKENQLNLPDLYIFFANLFSRTKIIVVMQLHRWRILPKLIKKNVCLSRRITLDHVIFLDFKYAYFKNVSTIAIIIVPVSNNILLLTRIFQCILRGILLIYLSSFCLFTLCNLHIYYFKHLQNLMKWVTLHQSPSPLQIL